MRIVPLFRPLAILIVGVVALASSIALAQDASLTLTREGKTDYSIVTPAQSTPVDQYAVQELRGYLKQITTAEFPVIAPAQAKTDGHYIFVGISPPVLQQLGGDPLAPLKAQEYVARSEGANIFLYGQGVHGNLDAVMDFLRESLGWEWYTRFEHPAIPHEPSVRLEPFHRQQGYSYTFRMIQLQRGMDWPYQMGFNQDFDRRVESIVSRSKDPAAAAKELAHFVSRVPDKEAEFHVLKAYLPPEPDYLHANQFNVIETKNYFETHPEWFSLDARTGKRAWRKHHLCFSNHEMRAELTRNIRKVADSLPEGSILSLTPEDFGGALCDCADCKALEAKYQTAGGPLIDYLIEICGVLDKTNPTVRMRTSAYRRDQMQRPPVLPGNGKLPKNLIVWFAPINDNYFADWTHPDPEIQRTYADLVRWGQIASELHMYMYPNPYGSGTYLPIGNIQRLVSQLRMAYKAGATGVFLDQSGQHQRSAFTELQNYLLANLCRDINQDADALIKKYTDYMYGPAGELVRLYLQELEQGRKAMIDLPPDVTYRSYNRDDRTFPYLTAQNIHRWQGYFDRMTQLVADAPPRVQVNVQQARRELDFATLWKWNELKKAHPESYTDHTLVVDRINQANAIQIAPPLTDDPDRLQNRTAWEQQTGKMMNRQMKPLSAGLMRSLVVRIEAGDKEDPLPAIFDGIDRARIRTFVPVYPNNIRGQPLIPDAKAPFGYAIPVGNPDLPFQFGFYQMDTKKNGPKVQLDLPQIKTGEYQTFKLGTVEISPKCIIWFSAASWTTKLELGDPLYEPGEDTHWEAYVTLRFDGPTYGSKPDETLLPVKSRQVYERRTNKPPMQDLVLVGRIILVKTNNAP